MRDIATADYWNKRVKETPDLKDMLFKDPRREEFWRRVRAQLSLWKDMPALDVCCGYGQFADMFEDYFGIDISDEMLTIASQRNPDKQFLLKDILGVPKEDHSGLVFEVNSLHSLGLSPQEFANKFSKAKIVACLEADVFTIFQNY